MPAINFGKFTTAGGQTIVSGISSGLNSDEIIDSLVKAKQLPADNLQDKIEVNNKKLVAYSKLEVLLGNFKSAADCLRNPSSYIVADHDSFRSRVTTLSSNSSIGAESFINVSASNGAAISSYNITDVNIAKSRAQITQSFPSKEEPVTVETSMKGKFRAGTFKLNGADITIEKDASLQNILSAINARTNETGVSAYIIQAGNSSDYQLSIKSDKTGFANAYVLQDPQGVLANVDFNYQNASDASFRLDGSLITRSSNVISDAVDDITFVLKQNTPVHTNIALNIDSDNQRVERDIKTFIGAYNDLMVFFGEQTERDNNTNKFNEDSILGGDLTTSSMISAIYNEVSKSVSGVVNTKTKLLSEIGVSFTSYAGDEDTPAVKNIMKFDASLLQKNIAVNFEGLRKLFEFNYTSSSSRFVVNGHNNELGIYDFNIDVDTSKTAGEEVTITYTDPIKNTPVTVKANYKASNGETGVITGKAGTPFKGLKILYYSKGKNNDSSHISISQGLADRVYYYVEKALDSTDGVIKSAKNSVNEANSLLTKQITKINEGVDIYRKGLLKKYTAVEKALSKINSVLQMLDAQDEARRNSAS